MSRDAPSAPTNIEPRLLLSGLGLADRRTLSELLAFLRDESSWKQLSDLLSKLQDKVSAAWTQSEQKSIDYLRQRLEQRTQSIESSGASDDALRFQIWVLLRDSFKLPPEITFSHRGAEGISQDIGARMAESWFRNQDADFRTHLPNWLRKPLGKPVENGSFADMVQDYAVAQLGSLFTDTEVRDEAERKALIDEFWRSLGTSENAVEAGVATDAGKQALIKLLSTTGSIGGLAATVNAAGFSAYILAAQASAVIPFVGGKTLVSLLAVVTSPVVVIPAMFFGLKWAGNSSDRALMTSFSCVAGSTLALVGMSDPVHGLDVMCQAFRKTDILAEEIDPANDRVDKAVKAYVARFAELEDAIDDEWTPLQSLNFDRSLAGSEQHDGVTSFLERLLDEDHERGQLAMLSIGDLVYHAAIIDPQVVAAADFASVRAVDGVFDFATLSDGISGQAGRALLGSTERLKGYVAEELVLHRLIEKGHLVERPGSAMEVGFDLVVDGQAVQVKCTDGLSSLHEHFDKYPDVPVYANSELQPLIAENSPAWADQVYFLDGFSDEATTAMTEGSLNAGAELLDYDVPIFAASLAAARNALGWWQGQIPAEQAIWMTATDAAGKGVLGIVGNFAGAAAGLILIGPAGAVILGPTGGVFGVGVYSSIKSKVYGFMDPEAEAGARNAIRQLANTAVEVLRWKLTELESRDRQLGTGPAARYARTRIRDERQFIREQLAELNELVGDDSMSTHVLADRALSAILRSKAHASRLQEDLMHLHEAMEYFDQSLNRVASEGFEKGRKKAGKLWGALKQTSSEVRSEFKKEWEKHSK